MKIHYKKLSNIFILLLYSLLLSNIFCISATCGKLENHTTLTLKKAIKIALKESPLLASKGNEVLAARQREKAAKGLLLPKIDAYSSYQRLSDPQAVVPIKGFGGKPPVFSRDRYASGIAIKLPVFKGGRLWTGLDIARLQKAISQEGLRLTKQELIYNVTNVFNQILFLKSLEKAQNDTLNALKKLQEDAKMRFSLGRLAQVDLMQIETQVAEQEYGLVATRQEKVRALQTLCQLIGKNPGEVLDVKGNLRMQDVKNLKNSKKALLSLILKRPDVERAKKEMMLAEREIRYEKGLHFPQIDLIGDYGRRAGSGFEGDEEVWSAGISIGLNIFSGGAISAKIKEAEQKYLAAKNRYRHLQLIALKEAEQAISRMEESAKRLKAAKTALHAAWESFRIEKISYEEGASSVTDVLLAQAAWLRAQAAVQQAIYDSEKALMDYKLATGSVEYEE